MTAAPSPTIPAPAGTKPTGQVALALAAWVLLCWLHRDNDGLWFPQDAPRHLAKGIFLADYLAAGLPPAREYARSYLVRYPILMPINYPPGFYLLEASAFSVLGPSPWAAKGLILGFALLATLYQVAWLRRFVDPGAGYLGAALPLLPCVVRYSHAILLNIPAFALQLAALYHARRWLEDGLTRRAVAAAAFAMAAMLFYQGAFVLVLVLSTWLVSTGGWRRLMGRRAFITASACGLLAFGSILLWLMMTPAQARWLVDNPYLFLPVNWTWYAVRMRGTFGLPVLAGAAAGVAAGLVVGRHRHEVVLSGGWIVMTYVFHSYLFGKDERYLLPLGTPLLSLTAVAVWSARATVGRHLGPRIAGAATVAAIASLLAGQVALARSVTLPRVTGFDAIAGAIRGAQGSGRGSILEAIEPLNATLLTCSLRLADPDFRLRVLPSSAYLLYAGVDRPSDLRPYGPTEERALEDLLAHSGCDWIAVQARPIAATSPLRRLGNVLQGPRFRLMGTFAVEGPRPEVVHLYRQSGPIHGLSELNRPAAARTGRMDWLLRTPIERP